MTTPSLLRRAMLDRRSHSIAIGAVALIAVLASQPQDVAATKSPYVAPKDKALIVFIRNRFTDRKMKYVILDKDRQCLAVMDKKKAELVPMKPGKHIIYALGGNVERVDVDVSAGRTYFVQLASKSAMAKGYINATPARRGTEAFEQLPAWTEDLPTSEAGDSCRGITAEDKRGRIQKKIDRTNADWKASTDEERAKHSLKPKDGMTAKEAAKL